MIFLTIPTNIDYLIEPVRLYIGDTSEELYSDSLIRLSLVSAVRQLQRRWNNRYLVYNTGMVVTPQAAGTPAGFIQVNLPDGVGLAPSGLSDNDIFRNSFHTFTDTGTLISQPDEYPIILTASLTLMRSKYTSSITTFQNWSDGEFSFSNVASARAYQATIATAIEELDLYFKKRLSAGVRDSFGVWMI